ncbi:MAG: 4Fe-4S binding protein [Alphaproteobacteria bacterium]|nr:4Fe-4S binding protein [Alphaproteobacteria bacterium]
MKKYLVIILSILVLSINIGYAQITGSINDRVSSILITEYFPDYTKVKINNNDSRIIEVLNNQTTIGYIYSTWDMVKSLGYDRSPYEIIIGLNTSGTIAGAKLTYHNEPLFEHDVSEEDLLKYVQRTKDINIANGMAKSSRDKPIRPDTVHRGTISSNLMHQAIFQSSRNAALSIGLYDNQNTNRLNYLKEQNLNWDQLVKNNYITYKRNYISESLKDYSNKNETTKYSEIAFTLITPRSIGYNILKKNRHDKYMASLNSKDQAILIAGNGYSFKGDKWRSSKKFERIRLVQGEIIIKFNASDHTRISKIQSKNSPIFKEVSIFKIDYKYNFDPTKAWYLELLDINYQGKNIKNIIIPYLINEELIIKKVKEVPIWINVWLESKFRIILLSFALLVLSLITIFQDKISKYRNTFKYIRISYLSFTLIWIGWYTGAQLSIFNILSIIRVPITGADLNYFLIDPLIFIILAFTIISALILGRGLFCGWLCPFGALQELIGWIAKNLGIKKREIPEKYYTKLWTIKYFILVTIIGMSFISMETASTLAEVEPFKTAIMRHFNRGIPYVSYAIVLLCLSAFMERGFCRFICPLGAGIAIIGKLRITDNLKRRQECGSPCNLCSTSCPVNAIPSEGKDKGKIIMSECFRCLDCQLEYADTKRCPPLVKIEKLKVKMA